MMKISDLPTYYNGITSFLSALAAFMTTIQANEILTNEAPSSWAYGIGVGIAAVTGLVSEMKRFKPAVDSAGDVQNVVESIEGVLDSFRNTTPTTPATPVTTTAAVTPNWTSAPVIPVQTATNAVESAVSEVTSIAQAATKTTTDILDEVQKVINTFKGK